MAESLGEHTWFLMLKLFLLLHLTMVPILAEETRECREQEYKDRLGNCMPCKQCDAGEELSKECGFGYGEDAQCVACRPSRFKEDRGLQKCKPCLDCALINRFQTGNCSATSNAVCGDCLPGFYRKTKLSGFLDMECIQCGDPPPPYEPHCSGRVNLVPIPSTVTSPRDMALAAVICSALAIVLLALLVLCVIYCKRQLLEKKPSGSLRSEEVLAMSRRPRCECRHGHGHGHGPGLGHNCGPVPLIPSLCCEDNCSLGRSRNSSPFHSCDSLNEDRHANPSAGSSLVDLEACPDPEVSSYTPSLCPGPDGQHCGATVGSGGLVEEEKNEGQREEENREEADEEEGEMPGRQSPGSSQQEQREDSGVAEGSSLVQQ